MTRLPNLDDYDRNYGDDDPADVYDRLHGTEPLDGIEATRAADEAMINFSGRCRPFTRPERCNHVFKDGSRCTFTKERCPGHKEKSYAEFIGLK